MISQNTIQEILSTAKIEDVVQEYVSLKRRGVNMIGLCPFHNEKTPSFTVSPSKNFYKCFGCGKGGSAVSFLMEHENFTYPEALRYLAEKYRIAIEETQVDDSVLEEQQKKESLLLVNEFANEFFHSQLLETEEGKSIGAAYFKHRGLLESTIHQFSLGYSPRAKNSLTTLAIEKGYKKELLEELGLLSKSGYDFFRERVIFPFFNLSGKVTGFGGRILNDQVKTAKYLNSAESQIYNKRKTLYGLYQSKNQIRKLDMCILVEGYTDVLSLFQNGIKNVVASSGTSLTVEQVRLIKRFTENVRVLFDGDQAGQSAALRSLDIFLEYGLNVEVVVLPDQSDPDSYMKKVGATEFENFIQQNSTDFIILLAKNIQNLYARDPVKKSIQIRELIESIAKITDQIKRSLYVKECSIILNMEESVLVREVNKGIKGEINKRHRDRNYQYQPQTEPPVSTDLQTDHSQGIHERSGMIDYQEKDVIRVLLQGGHLPYDETENHTVGEYVISNIIQIADLFESELYRSIIKEYAELLSKNIFPAQEHFLYHDDERIKSLAMESLMDPYHYANWSEKGVELQTQKPKEENYRKDSLHAVLRFKLKKIIKRITEIEALIRSNDANVTETLLVAKMKLQEERRILAEQQGVIVL